MKKFISLALSALMLIVCISPSFCAFSQDYPYVDADGYYHRLSDGVDVAFETDYEKIVDSVREALKNRENRIEFKFATSDPEFAYTYNISTNNSYEAAISLWKKIFYDALTTKTLGPENAGGGDYLFKNIEHIGSYGNTAYLSNGDKPSEGNVRYYPFYFKAEDIEYNGSSLWDEQLRQFAAEFGRYYLSDATSTTGMTDYQKVKTIYDYIVRNTDYDTDVYTGVYTSNTERYKMSHSAYGAIYGKNIVRNITDEAGNIRYYIQPKTVVSGEKIIENFDQGLAVCEGFSSLFCYLCNYFGIDCHIVDGDYKAESGKESDPHEWNYVYLDDGRVGADGVPVGYQWYQVDTTFAENKSYKNVDVNNYDYFLRGYENNNFTIQTHQQPYHCGIEPFHSPAAFNNVRPQLYTWDTLDQCSPSAVDYTFPKADISSVDSFSQSVIFKRVTDYGGNIGVITSYIYKDGAETKKIEVEVDKNGHAEDYEYDIDGFEYNAHNAEYTPILAYLVNDSGDGNAEYIAQTVTAKDVNRGTDGSVGEYRIGVYGSGQSVYYEYFKIVPLNMSNIANYGVKEITNKTTYKGVELKPDRVEVNDGYNDLEINEDYILKFYDSNGREFNAPKEIGHYRIDVSFLGNHTGTFTISDFEVEKIRLSQLNDNKIYSFPYYPEYIRKSKNINGVDAFLKTYQAYSVNLIEGTDFTAKSEGSMDYNSSTTPSGQIIITGIDSASSRTFGGAAYSRKINYIINQKFNLASLNLTIADNSANHVYTGSAVVPSTFNYLDKVLVRGKEYKIVGYENNVNAGTAYVIIEGVNGCEGRLKLGYQIVPASLTKAGVQVLTEGGISFKLTYGGKVLVNGTDYTVSGPVINGTKHTYTIKGKGNYNGSQTINITVGSSGSGSSSTPSKPSGSSTTVSPKSAPSTVSKPEDIIRTRATLKKLKAGKKCMTVTWAKQSGTVHGYVIEYSTSKKFKGAKSKTVRGNSKTSLKIKKLKKKKKYYVKVRSYYKTSKYTYCSAWSNVKSVKVK